MLARWGSLGVGTPLGRSRALAVGAGAAPPLQKGPPWLEAAPEQRSPSEGTSPWLETASASIQEAGPAPPADRAYPETLDFIQLGSRIGPVLGQWLGAPLGLGLGNPKAYPGAEAIFPDGGLGRPVVRSQPDQPPLCLGRPYATARVGILGVG